MIHQVAVFEELFKFYMMLRAETVSLKLSLESNFYEWDIEARKNSYDVTIL